MTAAPVPDIVPGEGIVQPRRTHDRAADAGALTTQPTVIGRPWVAGAMASLPAESSAVAAPAIRIALLDGFEVASHGEAVEFPHAVERLVALLAVHDRPLRRPYVAGSLWPDVSEAHADGSLRSALWRARSVEGLVTQTSGGCVRLGPGVAVDLNERLIISRHLLARSPAELADLAGLYQHELLPDWYEGWLDDWREQWRQVRIHALEQLANALVATGRSGEAIHVGLAAVRTDPLRESSHRALIEAHLAEGNAAEAHRSYTAYARLLEGELGLAPSPRIAALLTEGRSSPGSPEPG
jgi:DNA-binding SARP family transcriptional activator